VHRVLVERDVRHLEHLLHLVRDGFRVRMRVRMSVRVKVRVTVTVKVRVIGFG